MADPTSSYVFIYTLVPENRCYNLRYESGNYFSENFQAEFRLSVWQSMLLIYYLDKSGVTFEIVRRRAELFVRMLMMGRAFFNSAQRPLDYYPTHWVELPPQSQRVVVGNISNEPNPDMQHPENKSFVEAERILPLVSEHASLRRALEDFVSSISNASPDAYFYAYRAIENVRSHFQKSGRDEERKLAWNAMNIALNCRKEDYDELVRLSEKHRHAKVDEQIDPITASRQLEFVRVILDRFIKYLEAGHTDVSV
jgi:hypothetical protein